MKERNSTMTLQDNPLKWVFPLQHMAQVKIVEALWRNSAYRHELKYLYTNSKFESLPHWPMGKCLCKNIDKLLVPKVMKDKLKISAMAMVGNAMIWLTRTTTDPTNYLQQDENYADFFSYLIDNFSWKSDGCIDGRRMVQSYVRNKETVDFHTWKLLCNYCLEDDIIRFSETIDWKNCQSFLCSIPHCFYWYWRIYGKWPTKEMFLSNLEYSISEELYHIKGQYNENAVVRMTLEKSATVQEFPDGIVTIDYFRNLGKYEAQLNEMFLSMNSYFTPYQTVAYVLRQSKDNKAWLEHIRNFPCLFEFLIQWPWNMFTDNWMDILEGDNILPSQLQYILYHLCSKLNSWKYRGFKEWMCELLCKRIVYPFFKGLWGSFKRKPTVEDDSVREIYLGVYNTNDISLFKIVFDGAEPSQRINFLGIWRDLNEQSNFKQLTDSDYCREVLEEVLNSDEEREIFREIVNDCYFLNHNKPHRGW